MIPFWIPVTLVAALFQVWRTALQQRLRRELSVNAASFVRYFFALPTDMLLLLLFAGGAGASWPHLGWRFLIAAAAGGLAQIIATILLLLSFGYRNFAVGRRTPRPKPFRWRCLRGSCWAKRSAQSNGWESRSPRLA